MYNFCRSGMHADDLLSPVFSGHNSERTSDDTVGIYFYHSDHLGSANWITNSQGEAVQYLHYMPFGELWENQQLSEYDERFKFTGKERDTETGYDYFGARYYASTLPMWLSVDPLSDKYPNISPYAYCAWNPMKYVDLEGKKIVIGTWYGRVLAKLRVHNFEYKVTNQLKTLKSMDPNLNDMITDLEDSSINFYIKYEDSNCNHYNRRTKTIRYNPDSKTRQDGKSRPPEAALAHELGHAENDKNNTSVDYNREAAKAGDQKEL